MLRGLAAVLVCLSVVAFGGQAIAQEKKCSGGKVYDPETKKCVTPRGSH